MEKAISVTNLLNIEKVIAACFCTESTSFHYIASKQHDAAFLAHTAHSGSPYMMLANVCSEMFKVLPFSQSDQKLTV